MVVRLNEPDVAWALHGGRVPVGGVLRVFGRGLAWELRGAGAVWRCTDGRSRQPTPSTTLRITQPGGAAVLVVGAAEANCYEAVFTLPAQLAAGRHFAELFTAWGSAAVFLEVVAAVGNAVHLLHTNCPGRKMLHRDGGRVSAR